MAEQCPNCGFEIRNAGDEIPLLDAVRDAIDKGWSDERILERTRSIIEFCRDFDQRWAEIEAQNGSAETGGAG